MTKRRFLILTSLLCLALPLAGSANDFVEQHPKVADAFTLLDLWIEEQIAYQQLPGLAIGVVYNRELIWSKGYGFSDLREQTPVTPTTLSYRLGDQGIYRHGYPAVARRRQTAPGRSGDSPST